MQFHEIFAVEADEIAKRRTEVARRRSEAGQPKINRTDLKLEKEDTARDGTPIQRPTSASKVIGVALSGGGIRSSAFCLGVLQALDYHDVIDRVDYLSTVSGGGYVGTSMTAAMSTGCNGAFPFRSELRSGEVPAVQHIRDHSNYLFPQGFLNILGNVVVYLRGLAANVILILPWLLLAAAFTIYSNATADLLTQPNIAGHLVNLPLKPRHFGLTLNALALFVLLLAGWALWRSTPRGRTISDVGFDVRVFSFLVILILILGFCELQPLLLDGVFRVTRSKDGVGGFLAAASTTLKALAAILAPVGAIVAFLSQLLADFLKRTTENPSFGAFMARIALKLAIYLAGAAVPIALWVVYLYLSFWGIEDCSTTPCTSQAPDWLTATVSAMPFAGDKIACAYFIVAIVLLILGALLSPNSNSLHRLYRDRLSKAFLFDPTKRQATRSLFNVQGRIGDEADPSLRSADLRPLDHLKLTDLKCECAPYHLVNAALNIEASKYANRRGRNADFFIFSPAFVGSAATGYVATSAMEKAAPGLTAGSAMAISGAAASADMGSATIKPLTPTLAILNVRLGYWLTNPRIVTGAMIKSLIARFFAKLYFLNELLGLLTESSATVYLTDGGHIENLGIYELLRRRCKLIIAVDAEADPEMTFEALLTLQRYARIDQSIRIDLPWAAVRDATRDASGEIAKSGGLPQASAPHGPHCALGTIYYPRKPQDGPGHEPESESTGLLLYIKSSLTGDENDYIVDYKRRNPTFPHETTADQFFTEEQFEVYRALGFHAVNSTLNRSDKVAMKQLDDNGEMKEILARWQGAETTSPLEKRLREILGL